MTIIRMTASMPFRLTTGNVRKKETALMNHETAATLLTRITRAALQAYLRQIVLSSFRIAGIVPCLEMP
jgi:hypothetical protein